MNIKGSKIDLLFFYWLTITLILVFFIIIIGGLTRLTNSGLSIIEWELFKGILPPLDILTWNDYFDKYKSIPQYKILNYNMSLDEFKVIFYWEYFHRFLARLIGLFFFIPLIYFYFTNRIKKKYLGICFIIFFLIVLQGIVGWYMVKSGLVNDISVSHYRLSLHLFIAVIIISSLFWLVKNVHNQSDKVFFKFSKKYLPYQLLIVLIFFQIIMGAFVSGLDAGMVYQTWPLMGESFFPNDIQIESYTDMMKFDIHSLVQFYHRNLAYLIFLYVLVLTLINIVKKNRNLYKPIKLLNIILIIQIIIGILTLISGLNIYLASAHQITGILLIFSAINLYYFNAN